MKAVKISMVILMLLAIGNCTHKVTLALQPSFKTDLEKQNALPKVQPAIKFFKGNFQDKRTDISKLATFKQAVHTYNLFAGRPMEDAIFEGLQELFTSSGHEWVTDAPDIKINLQLLNVQASRNAGFVKVTASSSVQIKLDFVDAEGKMIYSEVYNGADNRGKAMLGLMKMVKQSVDESIINCINSVGKDEDLAKALKQFKTR